MGQYTGNRLRSSVVIAQLLDSEGFSDHVANIVEKYWLKNICKGSMRKRHRKFEQDITAMCRKLTDGERMILGKFISMHKRMSFDTGLRIGLTTFARKIDKEYVLADAITGETAIAEEMTGTVADGVSESRS